MTTRPIRSQYEDFMCHVNDHGVFKADRTGTGTTSVFGHQMRFDLNEGFPPKKYTCAPSFKNSCGSSQAQATTTGCVNAASPFGMNGHVKMAI